MIYPRVRIFGHYISRASLLLGLIEGLMLFAVAHILLSTQTSAQEAGHFSFSYFSTFVAFFCATVFFSLGLYNRNIISNVQIMIIRMFIGLVMVSVASYLLIKFYFYVYPVEKYPPRHYFYLPAGIALAIVAILCTRILFIMIADLGMFHQRIIVIGSLDRASRLRQSILGDQAEGFEVVGLVDLACTGSHDSVDMPVPLLNADLDDLWPLVEAYDIDEIVVAEDDPQTLPVHALLNCKLQGVRVTGYLSFVERELGRIVLDDLDPNWLIFSDGFDTSLFRDAAKRTFDLVVSLLLLIFTLPITAVAALLIKLDSPGPVFYRQERVGRDGKTFTLTKFRSMRVDAEQQGGPRWAAEKDDRITEVGAFIRQTRIDELPQIINVLRGEMSIIGPRPERPFFVDTLSDAIPYYRERHRVKPGITGWAQINYPYGASIEDAKEKLSYDLYYVKNTSLFLDVIILLQTVRVILWPSGVR